MLSKITQNQLPSARARRAIASGRIQTEKTQMRDSDLGLAFIVLVFALVLIGLTHDAVEPTWQPDNDDPVIVTVP
jgi:hypothetical protein